MQPCFFFFNDTATTEIYTLSLHDALPILRLMTVVGRGGIGKTAMVCRLLKSLEGGRLPDEGGDLSVDGIVYLSEDRKSTRLNSSHANISYAVFCLKKKNETRN